MLGPYAVSNVALGTMNFFGTYGPPCGEAEASRLLNRALDLGISHIDTATIYGLGGAEPLIGRAIGHRRAEYRLASKCVLGVAPPDEQGRQARFVDGRPESITAFIDASLQRLGMDFIDLYYLHRLDPAVPVEDSMGALARAVEAGKIGAIGLSEVGVADIRRAQTVAPVAALQSEYSLATRNAELGTLQYCLDQDIAYVAFSPVARGFLTGMARRDDYLPGDVRRMMPRFGEPHLSQNLPFAERFLSLAKEAGLTPAQLAIGWLLAKGPHVHPLFGTVSGHHLEDDISAAHVTLDADTIAAAEDIFPPNALAGPRYERAMAGFVTTELFEGEPLDQ